jgi:microcystin-dependent protein
MVLYPGGPPVLVRWFFCDPSALQVPQPNPYVSSIWDDPKTPPNNVVGEVSGRAPTWAEPNNAIGYTGRGLCGSDEAWQTGGAVGPHFFTEANGSAICCELVTQLGSGGLGLGGTAWPRMAVVIGSGGLGLGGLGPQSGPTTLIARGGLGSGGLAAFYWTQLATGGLGVGGSAIIQEGDLQTATGGLGVGGSAIIQEGDLQTATGGLGVGGSAIIQEGDLQTATGGLGVGGSATIGGDVPYVGEFRYMFSSTPPAGWLLCDGSFKSESTYAALYALFGSTFGTPSGGNFLLPKFSGRVPQCSGSNGSAIVYAPGNAGGAESVTLSSAQSGMPAHAHSINGGANNFATVTTPGTGLAGGSGIQFQAITDTDAAGPFNASASTPTMPPWLCGGQWFVYSGV